MAANSSIENDLEGCEIDSLSSGSESSNSEDNDKMLNETFELANDVGNWASDAFAKIFEEYAGSSEAVDVSLTIIRDSCENKLFSCRWYRSVPARIGRSLKVYGRPCNVSARLDQSRLQQDSRRRKISSRRARVDHGAFVIAVNFVSTLRCKCDSDKGDQSLQHNFGGVRLHLVFFILL